MVPRLPLPQLALVMATLFAVAVFSAAQDIKIELKKPYVRTNYDALSGTITFNGERPAPRRIDTSADPVCAELNPILLTEYAEGAEGRLANVLVYVEGETLQTYNFERPTLPVLLEHKGCSYVPHVLGIRVGQTLEIANSDPTVHNTHPTPKVNSEWNQSQPPGAAAIRQTLNRPERFIPFKDNQHPWEKAFVGAFDHPFFAVSDQQGKFRIEGLPPGQYTVVAWHERFGEKTVDITFLPGESKDLSFVFDAAER